MMLSSQANLEAVSCHANSIPLRSGPHVAACEAFTPLSRAAVLGPDFTPGRERLRFCHSLPPRLVQPGVNTGQDRCARKPDKSGCNAMWAGYTTCNRLVAPWVVRFS